MCSIKFSKLNALFFQDKFRWVGFNGKKSFTYVGSFLFMIIPSRATGPTCRPHQNPSISIGYPLNSAGDRPTTLYTRIGDGSRSERNRETECYRVRRCQRRSQAFLSVTCYGSSKNMHAYIFSSKPVDQLPRGGRWSPQQMATRHTPTAASGCPRVTGGEMTNEGCLPLTGENGRGSSCTYKADRNQTL